MNTLDIRNQINHKLAKLSPEQLNAVWQFLDALECPQTTEKSPSQTVLEKMGGYPKCFLEGPGNLSDREVRKQKIGEQIQKRHQQQNQ